jgi:hypothetical protein
MNRMMNETLKILRLLPRAFVMMLVLAAPVLAVPTVRGDLGTTIEAPAPDKMGAGLVLLVSLQRS